MAMSVSNLIASTIEFKAERVKTNIEIVGFNPMIFKPVSYGKDTKSMTKRLIVFNFIAQAESDVTPYYYWVNGVRDYGMGGPAAGTYRVFMIVPNVNIRKDKDKKYPVEVNKGQYMRRIDLHNDLVKVRCDCHDFRWRFAYYNRQHDALYGATPPPYTPVSNRGPVNPRHLPGCCKHIMASLYYLINRRYVG